MYFETRKFWRSKTRPINEYSLDLMLKSRKKTKERQERYEEWAAKNRENLKTILYDSLSFLADQALVDGPISGASRTLARLGYVGAAKALPVAGITVQAAYSFGSYAGNQTAQNIAAGIPSAVGLDYTPEIRRFESSALGSSRII
tara:strand:- start:546 stop:980 length:435 start_codon:yes stop_codon:yes gene_type:complete